MDQSFWQTGVAAKPSHSVWGFITGGLVWFALAFVTSYGLGMAYLAFSVQQGGHLVTDEQAREGMCTQEPWSVAFSLQSSLYPQLKISQIL